MPSIKTHPFNTHAEARVALALEVIGSRLGKVGLSTKEIAVEVRLSESRLRQLMKKELQLSACQCIRECRLLRAKELLESSLLSVKEIIAIVGIRDASHFSRDYKRRFGVGPREYRRGRRKADTETYLVLE